MQCLEAGELPNARTPPLEEKYMGAELQTLPPHTHTFSCFQAELAGIKYSSALQPGTDWITL